MQATSSGGVHSASIPTKASKNTRFVNNIYDSPKNPKDKTYPRLVSGSSDMGYRVVAPKPNSLWNENTEQNIRAMLHKRANKRMQEIAASKASLQQVLARKVSDARPKSKPAIAIKSEPIWFAAAPRS